MTDREQLQAIARPIIIVVVIVCSSLIVAAIAHACKGNEPEHDPLDELHRAVKLWASPVGPITGRSCWADSCLATINGEIVVVVECPGGHACRAHAIVRLTPLKGEQDEVDPYGRDRQASSSEAHDDQPASNHHRAASLPSVPRHRGRHLDVGRGHRVPNPRLGGATTFRPEEDPGSEEHRAE